MRLPIKSEPDAFRLTWAFVILVGLSVVLGYLVHPLAGVALFVLVMLAALAWDVRSREPRSALLEAEETGHERGARDGRRILVVANEALGGEALREEIVRRGGRRPTLEVLAPVLQSRTHFVTTDIDSERQDARRRLDRTLRWAREQGFRAAGHVGDPIDPLAGLEDELRRYDLEEVIFATHRTEEASWLETGMLERMREELAIPVTHVVVDGEPERGQPPSGHRAARPGAMRDHEQKQPTGRPAGPAPPPPPPKSLRRAVADFRTRFARRRSRGEMSSHEREIYRADTPADVTSVRAKSSRHGKSTADKWNQ